MLRLPITASSLTILSLTLGAPSAFAQTNGNNTQAPAKGVLEETIVTAQRREESLQDAAVAMQAYDEDALLQSGMESAQDLGAISPSLGISAGGGPLTSFFIRGVGALTVNPLTDSAVAQNVDGIYLGRSSGAAGQALYDLARVELLKGPQGTLYGRNATGGVVNYIPNKPVLSENSGYLQGEFGNFSKAAVQGAANISFADTAAMRISGNKLERDGYSDDGSNDQDSYSVRAQFLIEPNDNLSVRFVADYSKIDGVGNGGDLIGTYDNTPGSLTDFIPSGLPIDSGPTAAAANEIRTGVLHTPSFAFFQPIDSADLFQDISFTGYMAEINYQTDAGTLTFIPAYRESDQVYQFAGPGFAPAKTDEENSQTSFELRYATDLEGPLNGIIGAFYIDEEISTSGVFAQNYSSPIQNYDNGGDSWAIFGQGTFDVTDAFRLNAGIRYTEDSKFAKGTSDTFVTFCGGPPAGPNFLTPPLSFANGCASGAIPAHPITSDRDAFIADLVARGEIAPGSTADDGVFPLLAPGNISPNLAAIVNVGDGFLESELDYDEVTGRIGIEWDWGPSNLLYAGYETGYRAGGVDLSLVSPTYDPEYIDAFTIGSKNRFLDDTLQVNAEVFYWKYDGQQVTYFTTLQGASSFPIANADATIQGVDVDFIWAATESTRISGNFQVSDAEYDKLQLISDPGRGRFGCASEGVSAGLETFDCSGSPLLYNPEFGADLSVNHVIEFANLYLSLTASASYRDERQTNFLLLDETNADSYTTLNLDATLFADDDRWSLSAFGRNVTDERVTTNTNVSNRGLAYAIFSPPQTYGIRLRVNF